MMWVKRVRPQMVESVRPSATAVVGNVIVRPLETKPLEGYVAIKKKRVEDR